MKIRQKQSFVIPAKAGIQKSPLKTRGERGSYDEERNYQKKEFNPS